MTEEKKYKVLARKYRPQKFENLIGQELLVKILLRIMKIMKKFQMNSLN